MVVRTQSNGRQVTGLYIGTRNARRHFRKDLKGVELHLGHLHIHCDLTPEFWKGQPEIRDTRLGDWLESRIFHGRTCRKPVPMVLVPAEKNSFKLHPYKLPPVSITGLAKDHAGRKKDGTLHHHSAPQHGVVPDGHLLSARTMRPQPAGRFLNL